MKATTKSCTVCNKNLSFLEGLTSGPYSRCGHCIDLIRGKLKVWRDYFREACKDGIITQNEWTGLMNRLPQMGVSKQEAVDSIRKDALNFTERTFAICKSDGVLDEIEEMNLRWLIAELNLSSKAPYLVQEVNFLAMLRHIREGNIPTITPNVVLSSEELCYLETPATFRKQNKSGTVLIVGRLIVTNKQILFIASSGGGQIPLNKVANVVQHQTGIFLELSRQANNGFYALPQPELATAIILSAIRMATRQLQRKNDRDTRRVPQHVANAVWQRDGGKCVQCGATNYLEYDHVIPHSKGGATSVKNLQLLCRGCNAAKRDKI